MHKKTYDAIMKRKNLKKKKGRMNMKKTLTIALLAIITIMALATGVNAATSSTLICSCDNYVYIHQFQIVLG